MKINANISLKDRNQVKLGGFKGLDTLSASVDVSGIHATEMENLISRDGVNHKRYGWKTKFRIRDGEEFLKIQGIFNFTIFAREFLLAYAGSKFWMINKTTGKYENIINKSINVDNFSLIDKVDNIATIDTSLLTNTECKSFINGNKVYFIGCGDYLVFSQWNNGYFELRRVVDNEDVYIPTTTENIIAEEEQASIKRITAEERNILSPYTYNLLMGRNEVNSGEQATYYLDSKDFVDAEVEIEKENGDKILLTSNGEQTNYEQGNNFTSAEITLNKITETKSNNYSIINKLNTYTTSSIRMINPYWDSYEDAVEDGCGTSVMTYGEWQNSDWGSGDAEDYNIYLDYMYGYIFAISPNRQINGKIEDPLERLVYKKTYTGAITIPINNITKSYILLTFNDGSTLNIKNNIISSITNYKKIKNSSDNKSVDIDIYYNLPKVIEYSLVYKTNSSETILQTINGKNIGCQINSATISYDSNGAPQNINSSIKYDINYDTLFCDLSNYNLTIGSINKPGNYKNKDSSELMDSSEQYSGSISYKSGQLILNAVANNSGAYAPLAPDTPNIRVKLKRINEPYVINAKIACKFGLQGSSDRLFVVDTQGNIVRWSKDENFTYFGDKSWLVCGSSDKHITGMDRLNDTTLILAKEYSPSEPSIYVIQGNLLTEQTTEGIVDYTALFSARGYQVGMSAVGEIANFNGDCMMIAKDGMYAITLGENMTVDSRYVVHRSRQISNRLEKFNLKNAKCISFNGKFYVYVGGDKHEVYVADNKYASSFKGDMQNVVNYEWWRWTNIPISVWGIVNNDLWFGTDDGQICTFTDNFYDETKITLDNTLITYKTDKQNNIIGFDINESIKVKVGDTITPTCDFYGAITTSNFEVVGNETRFYLPVKDCINGDTIYIDNNPYDISVNSLYFSIEHVIENASEITFYKNYKNQQLTIVSNSDYISLLDKNSNNLIWSKTINNGGFNPAQSDFTAVLSNKTTVVAKWVSGAMDLGTRVYSKTLTYLILTGEKDLINRIRYGIRTRFNRQDFELLRGNNDLDFDKLDLDTVSIDSDFASSYIKKLNLRDVNFIMFYFISDSSEDVAINSIQVEYKLFKRNIGVR